MKKKKQVNGDENINQPELTIKYQNPSIWGGKLGWRRNNAINERKTFIRPAIVNFVNRAANLQTHAFEFAYSKQGIE